MLARIIVYMDMYMEFTRDLTELVQNNLCIGESAPAESIYLHTVHLSVQMYG